MVNSLRSWRGYHLGRLMPSDSVVKAKGQGEIHSTLIDLISAVGDRAAVRYSTYFSPALHHDKIDDNRREAGSWNEAEASTDTHLDCKRLLLA